MNKLARLFSFITIAIIALMIASNADAAATRSYQYDNGGRLQSVTTPSYKITYAYDKNGNIIKRTVTYTASKNS